MLNRKLAVSVIGNGRHDGIGRGTVGNTVVGIDLNLTQRVGVRTGLGVGDSLHRDCAVSRIGAPGDNLVALDELEGEFSGLEVAAGQGLGRLDLVGDAGVSGGQFVGILELSGLGILQDVLGLERTVAVVRDGGLDGELGIAVGDALAGGSALNLAQRVGVLAGLVVGNLAHRDLATSGVFAGSDNLVALDELEGELAGLEVAAGQNLGRLDLVGDAGALGGHVVGVLKLNLLNVLGVLQLVRGNQLALAVIGDGRHDGVDRVIVVNTAGVALNLMQLVGVLADLGVLDGTERHLAVGGVLNGLDRLNFLVNDFEQLKAELVGRKVTPGQRLGHGNLVGDAGLNRIRGVNVLELGLARGHLHASAQLTLLVGRYRHGDLRDVLAVGDAVNRGPGMLFTDLVDVRARFGVFDRAEVDGSLALVQVSLAHGRSPSRRHRGAALGCQAKLKRVSIRPVATLEHLGQAKAGLGVHHCRRHVIRKADLAVVAQVGIDMRRGRLGRHVVPLGVENVGRGTSAVAAHAALGSVELIDKGQTRGSHAKRKVAVLVGNKSAVKLRCVAADKLDDSSGGLGLAVRAPLLKLILVVIGASICQRILCRLRAVLIRVNGSLLLEVVVAVGVGRLKGRNRITQRTTAPLVRVEAHGLGAVNDSRIMLDVVLEPCYLLGRKQVVKCGALHARGILHLNGLNVVDRKLAVYGLKVTQRNQRRRNVNRYDIALPGIVIASTLHGDEQVFCLAGKLVGVGIGFFVDRLARLGKRHAVDDDFGKSVDLHKVAQLVGKRDVAGLGLVVALMDFGRIRRLRCDGL